MTIDPQKLLVGDRVTFHRAGITRIDHSLHRPVQVKYPSGAMGWVHFADIATHTPAPKPIKVGDWVTRAGSTSEFEILALVGKWVWLRSRHGMPTTGAISDLSLCEAPHE